MEINNITTIWNNITTIAVFIIWITGIALILFAFFMGKIYEKRFFKAVSETLKGKKFDVNECTISVRNIYEEYRWNRFGFTPKKIILICQELAADLRRGKGMDSLNYKQKDEWASRLDKVIIQLQYEESFDDEKANEIISELDSKVDSQVIANIRQKLIFLEAYHKGVIHTKNAELEELKYKMRRKQWITWISGIIGVVGSIASIYSSFK